MGQGAEARRGVRAEGSTEYEDLEGSGSGAAILRVHYNRSKGDYDGWGLHVWGDVEAETDWQQPLQPRGLGGEGGAAGDADATGSCSFPVVWDVPLREGARTVNLLPHSGDSKDCSWTLDVSSSSSSISNVWIVQEHASPYFTCPDLNNLPQGNLSLAKAHWVSPDVIVTNWDYGEGTQYSLHASATAGLTITGKGVEGADVVISLSRDTPGLSAQVSSKFPHLASFTPLRIEASADVDVRQLIRCQLALACRSASGTPLDASGV